MSTITRNILVKKIAKELSMCSKQVKEVIHLFLEEITENLEKNHRLEFRDFGVFEVITRKKKIGRNPKCASIPITIPERKRVKFTAGKKMKESVGRCHLEDKDETRKGEEKTFPENL